MGRVAKKRIPEIVFTVIRFLNCWFSFLERPLLKGFKSLARLAFVAASATVLFGGCSGFPYVMNPYQYQYATAEDTVICLKVTEENSVAMAYEVRRALEEKGLKVREVNSKDDATDCLSCVRFEMEFGGWSNSVLKKATLELRRSENGHTNTIRVTSKTDVAEGVVSTKAEDTSETIRLLVDQLFPHPIPWIAE